MFESMLQTNAYQLNLIFFYAENFNTSKLTLILMSENFLDLHWTGGSKKVLKYSQIIVSFNTILPINLFTSDDSNFCLPKSPL